MPNPIAKLPGFTKKTGDVKTMPPAAKSNRGVPLTPWPKKVGGDKRVSQGKGG